MNTPTYVVRSLLRSKRRLILTMVSVSLAVFLFVALKTVLTTFDDAVAASDDARLVTRHAASLTFPLPYSYLEKIRGVPGVEKVSIMNWFGGTYIDESHFFARFAVEMPTFLEVYPEILAPRDQLNDLMADRSGCLLGRVTAEKYGLNVGDRITLIGDIYPGEFTFTVRAIYRSSKPNFDETMMIFHWQTLDESLGSPGYVGSYVEWISSPALAVSVSKSIDALFANSPAETKTETEKAFNMAFMSMLGNITALLMTISAAIILSIVMVAANTMAMSIRERTSEIGLLKVLGFPTGRIFAMVMAEAVLLALAGGLLGVIVARLTLHGFSAGGALPFFLIRGTTVLQALVISVGIGAVAGVFPALRAIRISPIEALGTIG